VRRTVYKGSGDGPPAMRNWDLSAGTVHVRGTVIRMRGQGLTITSAPKTKAGFRTLLLPSWAVEILRMRPYGGPDRTVFCSVLGGLLGLRMGDKSHLPQDCRPRSWIRQGSHQEQRLISSAMRMSR
jgi:hypothetical protein